MKNKNARTSKRRRPRRLRNKLVGLHQQEITKGVHALTLSKATQRDFKKSIGDPLLSKEECKALAGSSKENIQKYIDKSLLNDFDLHERLQSALLMRPIIIDNLNLNRRTRERLTSQDNTQFRRLRLEVLGSPAGIVQLIPLALVLGGPLTMIYFDFQIAERTVLSGKLYDSPNLADPGAPAINPPRDFVAAFCFVPVCMLAIGMKALMHPPEYGVDASVFKRLGIATCTLAVLSTIGFAWIIGGHESLIANAMTDVGPKAIGGVTGGAKTPPFEYVALTMLSLAFAATLLSSYIPKFLKPFFAEQSTVDDDVTQDRVANIDQAISTSTETLSTVKAVIEHHEGRLVVAESLTKESVRDVINSEESSLRRKLKKLAGALLLTFSALSSGCDDGSSVSNPVSAAGYQATLSPNSEKATVDFRIFMSEMTPTARVRPAIENLLVRQLPGGSCVTVYEGEGHTQIASIDVPQGPPEVRVDNARFQAAYVALEEFFISRTPGGSDQVSWPQVAETIASGGPKDKDETWVLLSGSPLFMGEDNQVFSFGKHMVASHGFIGQAGTPFVTDIRLPDGTLVSWLSSNANWGDSRVHRSEVTAFQACYWSELSGRLTEITPDIRTAFEFKEPFGLPGSPKLRDDPPMMIDTKIHFIPDETSDRPNPTRVKKGFRRTSLAPPGSIQYRIEMAGGDISKLRGESLVIFCYIDRSHSMKSNVKDVVETISRLATELAPLVKSLEIGCVAASTDVRSVFPTIAIHPRTDDGGRSVKELKSFLRSIDVGSGDYATDDAIEEGIRTLNNFAKDKRQIFMLLTDVVAIDGNIEEQKRKQDRIVLEVKNWTDEPDTDRRVIALFSGTDKDHSAFVNRMASTDPDGVVSTDPDVLIQQIISAAIPDLDESILSAH